MIGFLIVFLIIFCLAAVALCGWCYDRSKYKNRLIERTIERDHYYDVVCSLMKEHCDSIFCDTIDLLFRIKTEEQPVELEVHFLSDDIEVEIPGIEWYNEVVLPAVDSKIYFEYIDDLYKKLRQLGVSINIEYSELDPTKRFIAIIDKNDLESNQNMEDKK